MYYNILSKVEVRIKKKHDSPTPNIQKKKYSKRNFLTTTKPLQSEQMIAPMQQQSTTLPSHSKSAFYY